VAAHPDGITYSLIDVVFDSNDIESAYYQAVDVGDDLADRLTFLSFAPVRTEVMSVTYPEVHLGDVFEIALPMPDPPRSAVDISTDAISQLNADRSEPVTRALRGFRNAVSAVSAYDMLVQLWTTVEILARDNAEKDGSYNEHECNRCGSIRRGELKTQPYVEDFLASANLGMEGGQTPGQVAAGARSLRGKIVHGGKLHDRTLKRDTESYIGVLQSAGGTALADALRAKTVPAMGRYVGTSIMFAQIAAREHMTDQDKISVFPDLHFGKWYLSTPASLPRIPERVTLNQPQHIGAAGIAFPLQVPNVCFPVISR